METDHINPYVWDHYSQVYWDEQLPLLIRFGFPCIVIERVSSEVIPRDIDAFSEKEILYDAIVGPFTGPSIMDLHISHMLLIWEKPNTSHQRVIVY